MHFVDVGRVLLMGVKYGVTVTALAASCAGADELLDAPLAVSDRAPLVQRFNLPAMRSADTAAPGQTLWRMDVDIANNFIHMQRDGENLIVDAESQRYELSARYGLGEHWEVGVMLPWISYNGGVLDNFIEGFHRFWGLPDGGRPEYPTRQLQILYQRNGRTELNFDSAEAGFGDAQIHVANQLLQTNANSVALIATLNLPTGDENKLTGTDSVAGGIALAATHRFEWPLMASINIGAQTLPDTDLLGNRQKNSAFLASGELAWAVNSDWRLRAQVEMHTALYDSRLKSLGNDSWQLLLGGDVRLSPDWVFEASVVEDVAVDTAPDVTLQIALKTHY